MYLLVICMSFLEKYLLKLLPIFKVGTTEYNLSLKKKKEEIMSFATTWMNLKDIGNYTKWNKPQRKTNSPWYHLYVELENIK